MAAKKVDLIKKRKNVALELHRKIKEKHESITTNSEYSPNISDLGKKLLVHYDKVLPTQKTVSLQIPEELLVKLGSGSVTRTGGVIRAKNGQIVKHLSEVNPNKISKAIKFANIAFVAFDIIEHAIIDEKLKKIDKTVKEIDEKIDAQNLGKYESAIEQFKELSEHANLKVREQRIPTIQNELKNCDKIFTKLYDSKWKEYNNMKAKFDKARILNESEFDNINNLKDSLLEYLFIIVSCKITQALILYQYADEFIMAQEKSFLLQEFLINQNKRFNIEFGKTGKKNYKENFKNPLYKIKLKSKEEKIKMFNKGCNETLKATNDLRDLLIVFDLTIPEYQVLDSK